MTDTPTRPPVALWARIVIFLLLVALAGYALPVSAFVVEAISPRAENWIVVVQIVGMVIVGAAMGAFVPALSAAGTRLRRAAIWAAVALLATLVGDVLWFVVLAG